MATLRYLVGMLLVVAMCGLGLTAALEANDQAESAPAAGGTKHGAPPHATLTEISDTFSYNDARGDQKYAKKQVDVIVKLSRIVRVENIPNCDSSYITMTAEMGKHQYVSYECVGAHPDKVVVAFFFSREQQRELADLKLPEQTVIIRGYCKGRLNNPQLRAEVHFYDCRVVAPKPTTGRKQTEGQESSLRVDVVVESVNVPASTMTARAVNYEKPAKGNSGGVVYEGIPPIPGDSLQPTQFANLVVPDDAKIVDGDRNLKFTDLHKGMRVTLKLEMDDHGVLVVQRIEKLVGSERMGFDWLDAPSGKRPKKR